MEKRISTYIFVLLISLLGYQNLQAQEKEGTKQNVELGIRLGNTRGSSLAIDATVPLGKNRLRANIDFIEELTLATLYNWTFSIDANFQWHLGAGLTLDVGNIFDKVDVDAVVGTGVEYKFSKSPISLGFDWQPVIELKDNTRFVSDAFAFTIRYGLN